MVLDDEIDSKATVHVQGLMNWLPISNVFDIGRWSRPDVQSPETKTTETFKDSDPSVDEIGSQPEHKGIPRLPFNLSVIAIAIFFSLIDALPESARPLFNVSGLLVFLVLMILRARNAGLRGILVPAWFVSWMAMIWGFTLIVGAPVPPTALATGTVIMMAFSMVFVPPIFLGIVPTNKFTGKGRASSILSRR
jgi:hypothetical protein